VAVKVLTLTPIHTSGLFGCSIEVFILRRLLVLVPAPFTLAAACKSTKA
jgi:hypothetical protein